MTTTTTTTTTITTADLFIHQWSEEILIHNIENIGQYEIMKYQRNLSRNFIENYLLNEKYNKCSDDEITIDILMIYQNIVAK